MQRVIDHFRLNPASHDHKALVHVLETFPRDELFQATIPDLVRMVRGIVNLYERAQVRLFVRRDPFRRFYSCLVYVPRTMRTRSGMVAWNSSSRGKVSSACTSAL